MRTLYLNVEHTRPPDFKVWTFPGGEVGVEQINPIYDTRQSQMVARLSSSNDLIALVLATDSIKRSALALPETLIVPYLPYGRQDRVTEAGGAFSLQAIGQIIDNLGYKIIKTVDPHSYVSQAVFNKSQLISVDTTYLLKNIIDKDTVLLAPDLGAHKRVSAAAHQYSLEHMACIKERRGSDVIITPPTEEQLMKYKKILIYDDICDGGATFVSVANAINRVLKNRPDKPQLQLFVTHGIFSKALTPFNNLFTHIYTTNTWQEFGQSWFNWNAGKFQVFPIFDDLVRHL